MTTAIDRQRDLSNKTYDVLVVGGGIVGAGIVRDAALRGLRAALVEKSDFASGTSSRSSRLLHGGLRYLAQGRIGMVREASKEKRVIHRIAPHLTQPLPFLFPTHQGSSWPRWKLWLGTKVYDLLCGGKNLGRSRLLSPDDLRKQLPQIADQGLTGGVRYYDGLTNDARLVVDTLRSARRHGAAIENYVELLDARRDRQQWSCRLKDRLTEAEIQVTSRSIVNATGPWSDRLPHSSTSLRLTKGVHLVINRSRLPVPDAVVLPDQDRILFAIPWGDRLILGTTDTDYDGPLESPRCETSDLTYVLDVVNRYFPAADLRPEDVAATWAGLRPLVADRRGNPSDISRRHEITQAKPGWWDVTGGKLTTYRLMAEELLDQLVRDLGMAARPCRTADQPLLTAEETGAYSGIIPPPVTVEAVRHYCDNEWAVHLGDVMIRRTSWRYYEDDHHQIATRVARWMAERFSWDDSAIHKELDHYQNTVSENKKGDRYIFTVSWAGRAGGS
ncbi:MAG: FAD-dependent oxidoreductase [Planctomycetales bacterium]|nr:FAD-dependent oxidoreductase [Planctomycetales bacterium]NIM07933.1 FAD-dependent oxidoreductase [Planctomycetales bacterium]NIN07417.1 FAD-dependent oxidoreductase [Planctomycetales bacterium]NIN76521.1 FAD-dependent oxidoreductase [Planctomycetales bacterium]NIO33711.1 FAD-dependent oxidoreductase [Planctomycetales bacterium]